MKPILFNTDMVRAILEGRKTVTRRVIKPQPEMDLAYIMAGDQHGKWSYSPYVRPTYDEHKDSPKYWTPPCHTGEILYVRETWAFDTGDDGDEIGTGYFAYKADDLHHPDCKWRPSIHMPKEAARIFLRVKNVLVERLQDITEEEAKAEGCYAGPLFEGSELWVKARDHFPFVWDGTLKSNTDLETYCWEANPWVWVIEFERCERPKEG